jgi:hypothetical protein
VLLLLPHPRRALAGAADQPRLLTSALTVVAAGLASLGLDSLAARIAPQGFPAPAALSLVLIPALLVGFWLMSAWLVDTGARLMGTGSRRRRLLAASGSCFPVLGGYGLVGLLQALASRAGAGDAALAALGLLGWVVLGAFLALQTVAIGVAEDLEAANALALALLPFAALSAAVLLYVVVISALHAAGLV